MASRMIGVACPGKSAPRCAKNKAGVNHEVQAAERLVSLVDAVDQVQHFQAEVNNEDVEKIHRDGVYAVYVDHLLAQLGQRM